MLYGYWLYDFLAIVLFAILASVLIQLVDDPRLKKLFTTVTYVFVVIAIFVVSLNAIGYLRLPR